MEFWPQGALSLKFAQNWGFPKNCPKTAWFWKNLGGKWGPGPPGSDSAIDSGKEHSWLLWASSGIVFTALCSFERCLLCSQYKRNSTTDIVTWHHETRKESRFKHRTKCCSQSCTRNTGGTRFIRICLKEHWAVPEVFSKPHLNPFCIVLHA